MRPRNVCKPTGATNSKLGSTSRAAQCKTGMNNLVFEYCFSADFPFCRSNQNITKPSESPKLVLWTCTKCIIEATCPSLRWCGGSVFSTLGKDLSWLSCHCCKSTLGYLGYLLIIWSIGQWIESWIILKPTANTFNPSECSWCEWIMKPCTIHLQKTETASSSLSWFFPWKTALLIFHLETHGALPGSKHHLE